MDQNKAKGYNSAPTSNFSDSTYQFSDSTYQLLQKFKLEPGPMFKLKKWTQLEILHKKYGRIFEIMHTHIINQEKYFQRILNRVSVSALANISRIEDLEEELKRISSEKQELTIELAERKHFDFAIKMKKRTKKRLKNERRRLAYLQKIQSGRLQDTDERFQDEKEDDEDWSSPWDDMSSGDMVGTVDGSNKTNYS